MLPVGRAWPWPARLSAAHRCQATTILTSRVISHHFPALQRARDERAAPHSSYGWPALHELFRTHRARNSSQGEAACSSLRHQETLRSALHQTRSHPTPTTPHVIFRFTPPATCCGLKSALHEPFRTHSPRKEKAAEARSQELLCGVLASRRALRHEHVITGPFAGDSLDTLLCS